MSDHLSETDLDAILTRVERCTGGPWRSYVEGRDHSSGSNFIMTGDAEHRAQDIELYGATAADQDFIAHAREDVPRLVHEIRRLRALHTVVNLEDPRWVRAYAVVRVESADIAEDQITVKEIVLTSEEAQREVDRLNETNRDKGCRYSWQSTHFFPEGSHGTKASTA